MRLSSAICAALLSSATVISGQVRSAAATGPSATSAEKKHPTPTDQSIGSSKPFRTPWGDPDLQGLWSNSTITPLERPGTLAAKAFLTEEEANAADEAETVRADQRTTRKTTADVDGAYNQFWWDRGKTVASRRTSLVVDPPDGRIPGLTTEGQTRAGAVQQTLRGVARGPEDRNLAERCLTRGAPKLPGGYNNNVHIFQTPGYVAILQEMIHEVRIIPLDGRPHLSSGIRQWMGDSRAHWEGDTLVVDTRNYHELVSFNSYNCCRGAGADLHIVERYTRTGDTTIDFEFRVDDPTTFTRPFSIALPMTAAEGPIYEYACHEGNYGMVGILSGARAQEKAAVATEGSK
jgi:hypothetical protein